MTPGGFKAASADPKQIEAWWQQHPNASIGIATGAISGVDVIDLDGPAGLTSWASLQANHGPVSTLSATTGSGGRHLFFRAGGLSSSVRRLGAGIDVRGNGGYVIAAPSRHRSGGTYSWDSPPNVNATVPAPQWLLDLAATSTTSTASRGYTIPEGEDPVWLPPEVDLITPAQIEAKLDRARPEHQPAIERMRRGEELFPANSHEDEIFKFLAYLRPLLSDVTDATILKMLAPSIEAMACDKHGLAHVDDKLAKVTESLIIYRHREEIELRELRGSSSSTVGPWLAPRGYKVSLGGIFTLKDDAPKVQVCSAPINVSEVGSDEAGRTYVTLRYTHGPAERSLTIPRRQAAGSELLTLSEYGAPVHSGNLKQIQAFLQSQEQEHHSVLPKVSVFTRAGWSPDRKSFVAGNTVIGAPGRVVGAIEPEFAEAFAARGDRGTYLKLCRDVIERSAVAEMAWASGYAAPLLRLLDLRSMVWSLWGASGSGKSAIQALAVSPFGRPRNLMINANVTSAALPNELARRSDLLCWVDDTQQLQRESLFDTLAYEVGSGRSGSRATQTGELRNARSWLSLAFVSGERPLLRSGVAAGARNRTLETKAEPLGDVAFAKSIHQTLEQHHGHTGPQFIEALMIRHTSPGGLITLREMHRDIVGRLGGAVSEQVPQVALLVLADAIARGVVFGEPEGPALESALKAGRALLSSAKAGESDLQSPVDAAYEAICSYVAANPGAFSSNSFGRCAGALFSHTINERKVQVAAILPSVFREIASENHFEPRQILRALQERGLCLPGDTRPTRKATVNSKQEWTYWFVLDQ